MRTKHVVKIQSRIVFLSLSGAFGAIYSENPKSNSLSQRPPGPRLLSLPCLVSGNRAGDINSSCWRGPGWHKAILRLGCNLLSGLGAGHWAVELQPGSLSRTGTPRTRPAALGWHRAGSGWPAHPPLSRCPSPLLPGVGESAVPSHTHPVLLAVGAPLGSDPGFAWLRECLGGPPTCT